MITGPSRRDSLNLRIQPEDRGLIDLAARTTGKTRTDFVLDAARDAAHSALLDRTDISVPPDVYAEFVARLDAPAGSNARLRKTLRTLPPWDES